MRSQLLGRAYVFRLVTLLASMCVVACAPSVLAQDGQDLELTATLELPGMDYRMSYPANWSVQVDHTAQTAQIFQSRGASQGGIVVALDVEAIAALLDIGLVENATLEDLVAFNAAHFGISSEALAAATQSDLKIFGQPARRVQVAVRDNRVVDALQGFHGDNVFLLFAQAPSSSAMEAFRPTWEQMLDSITPIER